MTFDEWLQTVPGELTNDPLWRNEAYRLAIFAVDLAWPDVSRLIKDQRTRYVADQLYRAVGSVGANISEGYGRSSGKDHARVLEYTLGSSREARGWYYQARHVLTPTVALHRMKLLTQITRLLLSMVRTERSRRIAEPEPIYNAISDDLLNHPPMPPQD